MMTDQDLIDRARAGEVIGGGAKQIRLLVAEADRLDSKLFEMLKACRMLSEYASNECQHIADRLSHGWSPLKSELALADCIIAAEGALSQSFEISRSQAILQAARAVVRARCDHKEWDDLKKAIDDLGELVAEK